MENGIIRGVAGEAADYAFRKSGFSYRWQETPAKRMMAMLKDNAEKVVMVGWFKNSEREKIGRFSIPVYRDKHHMIISKTSNEIINSKKSFSSLLADNRLTLIIKDGYSYGKHLDELIKKDRTNTQKVTVDMVKMVQMINSGRGDYMFSTQEEGEYLIKSSGVHRKNVVLKTFPDSPPGEFRYLFFSKKVTDSEIRIINRYIREFNNKGKQQLNSAPH